MLSYFLHCTKQLVRLFHGVASHILPDYLHQNNRILHNFAPLALARISTYFRAQCTLLTDFYFSDSKNFLSTGLTARWRAEAQQTSPAIAYIVSLYRNGLQHQPINQHISNTNILYLLQLAHHSEKHDRGDLFVKTILFHLKMYQNFCRHVPCNGIFFMRIHLKNRLKSCRN